jgi:hypothetical protein
MTSESTQTDHEHHEHHEHHGHREMRQGGGGGSGPVYGIGLIGAWVFYFKRAETNQEKVKAFFKGLVWPAFLVYDLLVFLDKEKPQSS